MIIPVVNIVERAFLNKAFGRVPFVVQHDHDRVKLVPDRCGKFHAGHLKCAVADEHERTQLAIRDLDTDAGRNREDAVLLTGAAALP